MNRRALFGKLGAVAAAVVVAPAVQAEAAPVGIVQEDWYDIVADCEQQGHLLERTAWGGHVSYHHEPYGHVVRPDGAVVAERTEALVLGPNEHRDHEPLVVGWLWGVHALGPSIPREHAIADALAEGYVRGWDVRDAAAESRAIKRVGRLLDASGCAALGCELTYFGEMVTQASYLWRHANYTGRKIAGGDIRVDAFDVRMKSPDVIDAYVIAEMQRHHRVAESKALRGFRT